MSGAVAVLALAAAGGGIAYATGAFTTPPGGNLVTDLAAPITVTASGTRTVQLGAQPRGTNAIDISFTCLSAGDFTFADGSSEVCDGADRSPAPLLTNTMPVAAGEDSTTITATAGARWRLTAAYATVKTTAWGVNASGQTYGTPNQHGTPDLVAAQATNGRTGYVYATQLSGPTPTSPSQAAAESSAPPRTLTVYESDGKTPIGEFVVDGGDGVLSPAAAGSSSATTLPASTTP
jgi:hypothetical protein